MSENSFVWDPQRIIRLLRRCGDIALGFYDDPSARLKEDRSIVTEADHEVEGLLESEFDMPSEGSYIIGEETVDSRDSSYIESAFHNISWIVDPIDGTAPYAHHIPTWGISIARMERARLTDGAVFLPVTGELFITEDRRVLYGSGHNRDDLDGQSIEWKPIDPPARRTPQDSTRSGMTSMIALSQGIAKGRGIRTTRPVQALGCAVVPLTYIMLDRYFAYTGKVKLWDIAGVLPMLHRLGFIVRLSTGDSLTLDVDERAYILDEKSPDRWKIRATMLCAATEDALDAVTGTTNGPR